MTKWPPKNITLESDEKYTRLESSDDELVYDDSPRATSSAVTLPTSGATRRIFSQVSYMSKIPGWIMILAVFLTAVCSILITTYLVRLSSSTTASEVMVAPCGSTAAEAKQRGCHFDVISFCWLPDACYDSELSDAFDGYTKWEWFLDPNKTQPITHEIAMTGEHTDLFVNWEYHLMHCTAMWKKLHRAVLGDGKRAIDGYIGTMVHTEHCSNMLLQDRDVALEEINTIIQVKFPDCGIV